MVTMAIVASNKPKPPPSPPKKKKLIAKDMVNHPDHYAVSDNGIECIDAIRAALGKEQFIGFLRGQVVKYQWRLGKKGDAVEDNKKSLWYSNKLDEVLTE